MSEKTAYEEGIEQLLEHVSRAQPTFARDARWAFAGDFATAGWQAAHEALKDSVAVALNRWQKTEEKVRSKRISSFDLQEILLATWNSLALKLTKGYFFFEANCHTDIYGDSPQEAAAFVYFVNGYYQLICCLVEFITKWTKETSS